jgi:ribosomal-protein-alanine N-acetyltransferase
LDSGKRSWLVNVAFDPMSPYDLASVLRIERASFPSAWSIDSYLRELRNPTSYYLVARLKGEVIGYAGMWVVEDEAHVSTIAVRTEFRRRGLAEEIMNHLIGVAEQRGATRITLEVREGNDAAQALYQKLGFRSQGLIPHYYGDTGENAFVMLRETEAGRE